MIEFCALLLTCLGVTPGPGWSDPILVTDSVNTQRRIQFIHRDEQGRFHLTWAGYNDEARIAYKMFLLDGTTFFPETMISLDSHSSILSEVVMGDSLIVFWRDYNPIYYAIRSLEDGSEITPATYLFSTSTNYPYIRACPDSLGRLHVLYNEGSDVIYAVWTPAPGSGFTTEYEWQVEGAHAGGVLLVDGNRVHLVVQDSVYHTFEYLQYDLEGNTVIPQTDFTSNDLSGCNRFPELCVDPYGDLMVVESVSGTSLGARFVLWKLSAFSGETIIDEKTLVTEEIPEMDVSNSFILRPLPGSEEFYLCWTDGYLEHKVFNLLMDLDGNILVDWHTAYDYSDEDPEDVKAIDGVVDNEGDLYIIYSQGETEPVLGAYPTFGWFDHNYMGIGEDEITITPVVELCLSQNPMNSIVILSSDSTISLNLRVFDISGREVSSILLSEGTGTWTGQDFSGKRLPAGIYTITGGSDLVQRITLLNR